MKSLNCFELYRRNREYGVFPNTNIFRSGKNDRKGYNSANETVNQLGVILNLSSVISYICLEIFPLAMFYTSLFHISN